MPAKAKRQLSPEQRAAISERNRQRWASMTPEQRAEYAQRGREVLERNRAERANGQPPQEPPEPSRTRERAPQRSASKVSAKTRQDAKTVMAVSIAGLDMGAGWLVPKWWTAEDRLNREETAALVDGVYAEIENLNPKWLAEIAKLAAAGVHAQLIWALTTIAMPRLIRHGIFKPDDPIVAAYLFAQSAGFGQGGPAVSVDTGPAPVDRGGNGHGQVDPGEFSAAVSTVGSGAAEQAG
jgi:hypothetical protein